MPETGGGGVDWLQKGASEIPRIMEDFHITSMVAVPQLDHLLKLIQLCTYKWWFSLYYKLYLSEFFFLSSQVYSLVGKKSYWNISLRARNTPTKGDNQKIVSQHCQMFPWGKILLEENHWSRHIVGLPFWLLCLVDSLAWVSSACLYAYIRGDLSRSKCPLRSQICYIAQPLCF